MCIIGGVGGNSKLEYSRWKEEHIQMYETRDYDVFRELPINSAWLKDRKYVVIGTEVSKVGMITKGFSYFMKELDFIQLCQGYIERF